MTAIIQFFTSHFFGNMVYGIINNLITFIFVWFIHAFIPYKPKYQSRKNLTRATLLMYVGLVIISYVREIPGCNAFHIFYPLVALYFVIHSGRSLPIRSVRSVVTYCRPMPRKIMDTIV